MDFVLNSFAILFVGTIDDMGEVKEFCLDFDDNYDLIGFGEYALNYVGLHLRAAKGLRGKLSFFCALLDVNCFAPAETPAPVPGPAHDHGLPVLLDSSKEMTRVAAQSRPQMPTRRPSSALGWGGVGTKVGQGSNKGGGMGGDVPDSSFL
jgi:hypothetical protein